MPDALDWLRQALGGSQTPEMAPGASWEAMQQGVGGTPTPPGILSYLQDAITGKIAAGGPAGEIERLKRELAVQPTHNYVISDPARTRIEIMRKYGLLPPLAVGAGGGLLGEE